MNDNQTEGLSMETGFFHVEEVVRGTRAYELYLEFRYEVFCKELHRIVPPSCPLSSTGQPIETDQYDQYSRHFMSYHKVSGNPAASVRVIFPSPVGLNVTPRYLIDRPLPYPDAREDNIGEISRMAIAPQFRRRQEDRNKPFQGDPESEMSRLPDNHRHHQPELVLGMYREIYLLCKQNGINYCMAAMENRFSRLLKTLGFPWVSVGPVNESVDPPRRAYLISAVEMERSLSQRETCILSFLQAQDVNNTSAPQQAHPSE
jgi:N-acyl amino acid synthase of PEP-CTERM/exosortase system